MNYCTKAFPGRHGADEIEPWLRQVGILKFKFQLSCRTIFKTKNVDNVSAADSTAAAVSC